MATVLTQDAVLHFLQISGGSVKNSDLLQHFRTFIRDHADRDRNRELFKKFVNSVATVKQTDGVSYVILRKKFRGHVPGGGRSTQPAAGSRCGGREATGPAPPGEAERKTILPTAGIVANKNEVKECEEHVSSVPPPEHTPEPGARPGTVGRPGPEARPGPVGRLGPETRPGLTGRTGPAPSPGHAGTLGPELRPTPTCRLGPVGDPVPELKTSLQKEPAAPHQDTKRGQQIIDLDSQFGESPVVPAVHQLREVCQHVPECLRSEPQESSHQNPGDLAHPKFQELPHQNVWDISHQNLGHPTHQNPLDVSCQNLRDPSIQNLRDPSIQNLQDPTYQSFPDPSIQNLWDPSIQNLSEHSSRSCFNLSTHNIRATSPQKSQGSSPRTHQTPSHQSHDESSSHTVHRLFLQDPQHCSVQNFGEPPRHPPITQHRLRHRQSYKTAVSCEDSEEEEESQRASIGPGRVSPPLCDPRRSSSPAFHPVPSSLSGRTLPLIDVQDMEETTLTPLGPGCGPGPRTGPAEHWTDPTWQTGSDPGGFPSRHGLLLDATQHHGYQPPVRFQPELQHHANKSSPRTPTGSGSPRGLGWQEDPQARAGPPPPAGSQETHQQHGSSTTPVLRHGSPGGLYHQSAGGLSPMFCSTDQLHLDPFFKAGAMPWHLSTGDLYDDHEDAESSEGSVSSPRTRSAVTKRLSGRLRNRMCRSLGADLDRFVQDEATGGGGGGAERRGGADGRAGGGGGSEAARMIRLHRISSSLSVRYLSSSSLSSCSTPPRCHSMADLMEMEERKRGRKSPAPNTDQESRGRQSLVPLEPREHAWLVKAAAGAWPNIYSLFREEPSLLNRQDFISGFTVLHWIAKHGDHRVLNTLWYGVDKAGMTFDVDARSTSGQTALHIAAIHGNKNIMRLLVTKFQANVRLRDTSGKKAWQYLSCNAPLEMFQLLGAPARAAVTGAGVARVDSNWDQQQRRRRHHFSMASSAERPLKLSGGTKVKRSSSIAAFLKHKSLHRFYGHRSDSPL